MTQMKNRIETSLLARMLTMLSISLLTIAMHSQLAAASSTYFCDEGAPASYVVPSATTNVYVVTAGAAGAASSASTPIQPGSRIAADIAVAPGDDLSVIVG